MHKLDDVQNAEMKRDNIFDFVHPFFFCSILLQNASISCKIEPLEWRTFIDLIWRVLHMISAGDFRNGMTFEMDGQVVQVIEFQHVKPGKGAAFVRTKYKNVITGAVVETSFNPTAKFPTAFVERKDMQYSYNDGELFYFMDMETYDQVPISKDVVGNALDFVKEEEIVKVLSYKGNVFGIEPPFFVELTITETEPGVKGNTATNATKPAVVETGAEIRVPLFINEGDKIRIDTRTGEYMERA